MLTKKLVTYLCRNAGEADYYLTQDLEQVLVAEFVETLGPFESPRDMRDAALDLLAARGGETHPRWLTRYGVRDTIFCRGDLRVRDLPHIVPKDQRDAAMQEIFAYTATEPVQVPGWGFATYFGIPHGDEILGHNSLRESLPLREGRVLRQGSRVYGPTIFYDPELCRKLTQQLLRDSGRRVGDVRVKFFCELRSLRQVCRTSLERSLEAIGGAAFREVRLRGGARGNSGLVRCFCDTASLMWGVPRIRKQFRGFFVSGHRKYAEQLLRQLKTTGKVLGLTPQELKDLRIALRRFVTA